MSKKKLVTSLSVLGSAAIIYLRYKNDEDFRGAVNLGINTAGKFISKFGKKMERLGKSNPVKVKTTEYEFESEEDLEEAMSKDNLKDIDEAHEKKAKKGETKESFKKSALNGLAKSVGVKGRKVQTRRNDI